MAKTPEYGERGTLSAIVYFVAACMLGLLIWVHLSEITAKTESAAISRTEDQRNNLKKGETEVRKYRNRRIYLTVVFWISGALTTYTSSRRCSDPEWVYSLVSCHSPLASDLVALGETVIGLVVLGWSGTATPWEWSLNGVGGLGGILSLLSSFGNLGQIQGTELVWFSDWRIGAAGFVVATIVREWPVTVLQFAFAGVKAVWTGQRSLTGTAGKSK